ncbi:MAG TPA: aminotransferase, partial [Rubrobacteraceae bacterium]|nr:aminotransferase [Rubrobacteraceae bacterium]
EHNWINREGSEDFAGLVEYRDGFQPGARRYDVGERSNPVLLSMANEALRQILTWGVGNIAVYLQALTARIEDEAKRLGMEAVPGERRVGHMIGLGIGPEASKDLATRLASDKVFVSVRGRALRVSPHLYNIERDVERLFDSLARHAFSG